MYIYHRKAQAEKNIGILTPIPYSRRKTQPQEATRLLARFLHLQAVPISDTNRSQERKSLVRLRSVLYTVGNWNGQYSLYEKANYC